MYNTNDNSCYNYLQPVRLNHSHQFPQTKNIATHHTSRPQTQMQEVKSGTSNRSKSKPCRAVESALATSGTKKKKLEESIDDCARILERCQSKMDQVPRRSRSANSSPSAWALSPGRPLHPVPTPLSLHQVPKSPTTTWSKSKRDLSTAGTRKGSSTGVSVSGVLKYLSNKMKKVSPVREEEYHQFRIMHNRLLQWRFVNARSEVSMTALKRVAHKKFFNAGLKISTTINFVADKRAELQRIKQEIKLYRIISSEICLLKEWAKMESRNCEAVGGLARKLSTISICFPLVQDAEGDIASLIDAISMATKVVDDIEAMIKKFEAKVEQVCFLLTELSIIVKEHRDCVNELENGLAMVASLEAQETRLRVHCMELAEKSKKNNQFD